MKRVFFLSAVVVIMLLLVSCGTSNPFGEKNPIVYSIGQEGSYVFTTTDKETVKAVVDLDKLNYKRVSGVYNPQSGVLYGAVEGSFSRGIINTGLSFSKDLKKVKGDKITYYSLADGTMSFYVPANGIVFFANSDIERYYNSVFIDHTEQSDPALSTAILSESTGVYVINPSVIPNIGFDFSDQNAERFNYLLLLSDSVKYCLKFGLKTHNYSDSFFKLIKASYTTSLKEQGIKPDLNYLKNIIVQDGLIVTLSDQVYNPAIFTSLINQM